MISASASLSLYSRAICETSSYLGADEPRLRRDEIDELDLPDRLPRAHSAENHLVDRLLISRAGPHAESAARVRLRIDVDEEDLLLRRADARARGSRRSSSFRRPPSDSLSPLSCPWSRFRASRGVGFQRPGLALSHGMKSTYGKPA